MLLKEQILLKIKEQILAVLPGSTVILFGSRVDDTFSEESDWDILVLTNTSSVLPSAKKEIHNKVFPLSVSLGTFINLLVVTNSDWQNNPSYYSLKHSIGANKVVL